MTPDEYIANINEPLLRETLFSVVADIKNLLIHVEQLQDDVSNIEKQLGVYHDRLS